MPMFLLQPGRAALLGEPNNSMNCWLFWQHPDKHWVTLRKLENWEIMQIEDGIDEGDYIEIRSKEEND